jgi:hypothetical protein
MRMDEQRWFGLTVRPTGRAIAHSVFLCRNLSCITGDDLYAVPERCLQGTITYGKTHEGSAIVSLTLPL